MLVAELRERGYDPFPKSKIAQKSDASDDVNENEDEIGLDDDDGARDFDYLLGVSFPVTSI